MGKKKIALVDLSQSEKAQLKATGVRSQRVTVKRETVQPEPEPIEPVAPASAEAPAGKSDLKEKRAPKRIKHGHSRRYQEARAKLKNESYSLSEAVKLLKEIARVKFDPSVELHLNLTVDKLNGEVTLPHGSGKKLTVEIASDKTLVKLNEAKIDFDVLIAPPPMMAKLAKYARILGPKGLMPNPKNGTISAEPEAAAKKFSGGLIHYKSEPKAPLMHLVVGKLSFTQNQLLDNLQAVITAVQPKNISAAYLCSSMSPSLKLQL